MEVKAFAHANRNVFSEGHLPQISPLHSPPAPLPETHTHTISDKAIEACTEITLNFTKSVH